MPSLTQISQRLRSSFVVPLLILMLSCAAILWILNAQAIIQGPWANILSIIFTVLSVLLTLLQWLFPVEVFTPSPICSLNIPLAHSTFTLQEQLLFGISRRKGAVLIRVSKQFSGTSIHLYRGFEPIPALPERAANVVERSLAGSSCFVAIFPALNPGNYTLRLDESGQQAQVTVLANQPAEIDWRWSRPTLLPHWLQIHARWNWRHTW